MKARSIKTDNFEIENKIYLRKQGTAHLKGLKVLDLFAGKNLIWQNIPTEKYYGIEIEKKKGRNLCAENLKVIPSLDLSRFNVIDADAYGIPFEQIQLIFQNQSLQKGTIIFYTCISSALSGVSKACLTYFSLSKIYKKNKILLNKKSKILFYAFLYKLGIRKIYKYTIKSNTYNKDYGYFIVDSKTKKC